MKEITNKFLKAQSYFLFSFCVSVIVTFVALHYIPGNGTGVFSYIVGFSFVLSATIITQFFFLDVLLDNRARNVPVPRDQWFSVVTFYLVGLGIAILCAILTLVTKKFAWGFSVGTAVGVLIPTLVVILAVRGLPWIERKQGINKFLKAQSYFFVSLTIAILSTFLVIQKIPGSGTGVFSYIMGFILAFCATVATQMFLGSILDYRSRNQPVLPDERESVITFYSFGFGIAIVCVLLSLVTKNFAWGFSVGIFSGIIVQSSIVFIVIRGLPWIERGKKGKLSPIEN
ncbi:MAG: hypothetical protein KBD52_01085 [Candidatus Pacebacteria bacterium]|nr:hypothetical protein [Candidatus Paceibacterota bacterium]